MFSARRAKKSAEAPGGRWRLDLVYFALAAFDILTICAALLLNHVASTAFERSVRLSQDLSTHLEGLLELQHAAQLADAPGNDVFYTRDVPIERARRDEGLVEFNARLREMIHDQAIEPSGPENERLLAALRDMRPLMDEMMRDTTVILDQMERGDVGRAGRHMASLDRAYAKLNSEIERAISRAEQIQVRGFEEQVRLARQARQLEWAIAVAVLLSVTFVVFYGLSIGRAMRAADAQRARTHSELEAAHQRLVRYADNVSHELRGPISKMRVNMEVLLAQDREGAEYKDGLYSSLEDCERLSSIIDGLLFLARAENTDVAATLPTRSIEVGKELALISDFFSAAAEQAGVDLIVQSGTQRAEVDRALFQRAVVNIVSNAVSHTQSGGRIVLSARETAAATEIDIEDNGAGISAEDIDSVFDRFHSTSTAPKSDGAGLGLGLPITKAIMELHGGTISLKSERGCGTRVTLRFPRRAVSAAAQPENVTAL